MKVLLDQVDYDDVLDAFGSKNKPNILMKRKNNILSMYPKFNIIFTTFCKNVLKDKIVTTL